jgi:hypothetical protein
MRAFALALTLLTACTAAAASAARGRAAPPRYPLYCAGLMAGISRERDALRMYGPGLVARGEGHGIGRYYVDPAGRVTLHIAIGDGRVETVEYSRGVAIPASLRKNAIPKAAVAEALPTDDGADGIRLGASAAEVMRLVGKPKKDARSGARRVLTYGSNFDEQPYFVNYDGIFTFENGKLIAIHLHNGC